MFVCFSSALSLLIVNIPCFVLQDDLCYGISSDSMVVKGTAETVLACAPTLTQVTLVD